MMTRYKDYNFDQMKMIPVLLRIASPLLCKQLCALNATDLSS